jgi:hypothetical protein
LPYAVLKAVLKAGSGQEGERDDGQE